MNFVQTMKSFSVQALFRTATYTALAGALAVTAQAGVIYSTNFSTVTLIPSATLAASGLASELVPSGNIYYQGQFNLPSGLSIANGNVYAYQYTGTPTDTVPGQPTSGTDYGLLLNSACTATSGTCNGGSQFGSIALTLTGLTTGQMDSLTVEYWGLDSVPSSYTGTLALAVSTTGAGGAGTTQSTGVSQTTPPVPPYQTLQMNFTPTSSTVVITLTNAGTYNMQPSPIIGDVSVASVPTPEPSTALFLLLPAALFLVYRRRNASQN